jgi:hypothetical protein
MNFSKKRQQCISSFAPQIGNMRAPSKSREARTSPYKESAMTKRKKQFAADAGQRCLRINPTRRSTTRRRSMRSSLRARFRH